MLSSAGVVADCCLHRTSAIQDLQVLAGTQQHSAPLELWQILPYTTDLPSRTCRSWKELSSAGPVADCSLHCTSAIQDLQVLAGAQLCSVLLELWQIVPYTTDLPSRTCRSWKELSSARQHWSCGRLLLSLRICHPGPAGPGMNSTALSTAGAVADCSLHHRSAIQDLQVLEGTQQRGPCGRLFLTLHICHPGPAGSGRSSAALGSTGVVADSSFHRASAIQDLQILTGDQKCSAVLELWQSLPHTTNLPSRTCRSWMELSSAGLLQIIRRTANLPSKACRS